MKIRAILKKKLKYKLNHLECWRITGSNAIYGGRKNLTALQIYEPISLRRHGKKAPTYVNWGMSGDCKLKRECNKHCSRVAKAVSHGGRS